MRAWAVNEGLSEWLGTSETWYNPRIRTPVKPTILLADEGKPKRYAKFCFSRGAFGHCRLGISGSSLVWCKGMVTFRYANSCDLTVCQV